MMRGAGVSGGFSRSRGADGRVCAKKSCAMFAALLCTAGVSAFGADCPRCVPPGDGYVVAVDKPTMDATGWVPKEIMPDELHPAAKGYEIWAEALKPYLREAGVQSQDGNK